MRSLSKWSVLLVGVIALLAAGCSQRSTDGGLRIAIVAKSLGNGFFNAVHQGAEEAAAELGGIRIIFTGPTATTAEGQIEVINALIAQRVAAIAVSANDFDALVPALRRAQARGIPVMSFDSAVASAGRVVHLAPSSDALIGRTCLELVAAAAPARHGKFAIVSATPTSTNQNAWITAMREALPAFPGLELAAVVYGDDLADKSYRETTALLQQHPDLAVIVAPSSVGIVAVAKAVDDAGLTGKVFVTGLGLPSEMAGAVLRGTVKSFAIWNPIDLGYATTHIAARLARGEAIGPGFEVGIGRLGSVAFDAGGNGAMAPPFIYDRSNVERFAKFF